MRVSLRTVVGCVMVLIIAVMLLATVPGYAAEKKMVVGSRLLLNRGCSSHPDRSSGEKRVPGRGQNRIRGNGRRAEALLNKQIDIYVEYTGTALLRCSSMKSALPIRKCVLRDGENEDLEKNGVVWLPYMDFNNTYCLMMPGGGCEEAHIKTLSDLAKYVKANKDALTLD